MTTTYYLSTENCDKIAKFEQNSTHEMAFGLPRCLLPLFPPSLLASLPPYLLIHLPHASRLQFGSRCGLDGRVQYRILMISIFNRGHVFAETFFRLFCSPPFLFALVFRVYSIRFESLFHTSHTDANTCTLLYVLLPVQTLDPFFISGPFGPSSPRRSPAAPFETAPQSPTLSTPLLSTPSPHLPSLPIPFFPLLSPFPSP